MKKSKIAVDADGVLFQTISYVCQKINEKHGLTLTHKNVTSWDWLQESGFQDDFWRIYDEFDTNGRLELRPYDESTIDTFNWLAGRHEVEILTCNESVAEKSIKEWLTKWGAADVPVRCLGRKGHLEKLEYANEFPVFFDDNPNFALEMKNFPNNRLFLFNCAWNGSIIETPNVKRVRKWEELKKLL